MSLMLYYIYCLSSRSCCYKSISRISSSSSIFVVAALCCCYRSSRSCCCIIPLLPQNIDQQTWQNLLSCITISIYLRISAYLSISTYLYIYFICISISVSEHHLESEFRDLLKPQLFLFNRLFEIKQCKYFFIDSRYLICSLYIHVYIHI